MTGKATNHLAPFKIMKALLTLLKTNDSVTPLIARLTTEVRARTALAVLTYLSAALNRC